MMQITAGGDELPLPGLHLSDFLKGRVRVFGFDIQTGTVPQLATSTWWKVARSAGVCIREGRPPEPVYEFQ